MTGLAGGPTTDTTSSLIVGKNGGDNYAGLLDELKLWTSALTDEQICLDACGTYAGGTCTFDGLCP